MLDKITIIDRIEVLPETGSIQVREKTSIVETIDIQASDEDGKAITVTESKEISFTYHRYVIEKGTDVSTLPKEIQPIAAAAWESDNKNIEQVE